MHIIYIWTLWKLYNLTRCGSADQLKLVFHEMLWFYNICANSVEENISVELIIVNAILK